MKKRKPLTQKDQIAALWTRLVESAFDFFERAIKEYESSPKYAVLHLAASVELFLKARLMAEHWALIIARNRAPQFASFLKGDFLSVDPSEAVARLNGVLPASCHVSKEAECEFKSLMRERNKIAHFFHPELGDKSSQKSILQRQCRVWLHVHRLLHSVWNDVFKDFSTRLAVLNRTMMGQRRFLKAMFDSVKRELRILQKQGSSILPCQACGCDALVVTEADSLFSHALCKVCGYGETALKVDCPECTKTNALSSGDGQCDCGHQFSPEELADILDAHRPGEMDHAPEYIHCPDCYHDAVFKVEEGYACLNCFQTFEEIGYCEWCSTPVAGGVGEDSNWRGCEFCEGYAGHMRDGD